MKETKNENPQAVMSININRNF